MGSLGAVWSASTAHESRAHYANWAANYDAENLGKGMRLPFLGAAFLAQHLPPTDAPVLDAACGTGLVGDALHALGFETLVGSDLSPDMLRAGVARVPYKAVALADLMRLPFATGTFAGFTAIGAFGPGHAPPASLEELARVTRPGGIAVFQLREDTHVAQGFPETIAAMVRAGTWRELAQSEPVRAYLLGEPELYGRFFVMEVLS